MLKSDYFRIEILKDYDYELVETALKSDYFRIEIYMFYNYCPHCHR